MQGIIYKAASPDGKVYIGQTKYTLAHRKAGHKIQALKGDRRYPFCIAILEHGFSAFQWEEIDMAENQNELDAKEKYWIDFYNSTNPEHGYNGTDGGEKTVYSPETRQKISEALKGKKRSEEIRKKFSSAQKLRFQRDEGTFLGKKHTAESLQKMSEIKKGMYTGEKNPAAKLTEETARQIKIDLQAGMRICDIARKYNIPKSTVKNIKYGRTWAYIEIGA